MTLPRAGYVSPMPQLPPFTAEQLTLVHVPPMYRGTEECENCLEPMSNHADQYCDVSRVLRRLITTARGPRLKKVWQKPNGCWAACLATLTGIPLDAFPDLPTEAKTDAWWDEHGTALRNQVTQILRAHGWRKESTWKDIPAGYALAYGTSHRGQAHAVIVKDGELWHDPHPQGAGVTDIEQYEILVRILPERQP